MSLYLSEVKSSLKPFLIDAVEPAVSTRQPTPITGVFIDSREVTPGSLFIALPGSKVDGYDYIPDAKKRGAAAVLTNRLHQEPGILQFVCHDVEKGLAAIAKDYRQKMSCHVVALTGSNGKTTVKEMLASIFSQKAETFATPGNKNNHLGVPLSVLQIKDRHQYAVLELGASHIGEIAYTVDIAAPDVALINNIGPAHIEGFGSIDGVARAKGEIYAGLPEGGVAVVNADDTYAHFWDDILSDKTTLHFSSKNECADIYAKNIVQDGSKGSQFLLVTPCGEIEIRLRVPGKHHIQNALAAATCAQALGISLEYIAKGLLQFQGVSGRLTPKVTKQGALILDDTYNANLSSVLAGIDVLQSYKGKRILVLGDMGELGDNTLEHHEAVGIAALDAGLEVLLTCGQVSHAAAKAFGPKAAHFTSQEALASALTPMLDPATTVLVKGSRSSAMEKVVGRLLT